MCCTVTSHFALTTQYHLAHFFPGTSAQLDSGRKDEAVDSLTTAGSPKRPVRNVRGLCSDKYQGGNQLGFLPASRPRSLAASEVGRKQALRQSIKGVDDLHYVAP